MCFKILIWRTCFPLFQSHVVSALFTLLMFCIRKTLTQQQPNHKTSCKLLLQTLVYEKYLFLSRNGHGHFPFLPPPLSPPEHRITEWFGLEETLKILQFHLPAMGRDTFHQITLPKALKETSQCMCQGPVLLHKPFLSNLWIVCRILGEFWTRVMTVLVFYPRVFSRFLKNSIWPSGIIF